MIAAAKYVKHHLPRPPCPPPPGCVSLPVRWGGVGAWEQTPGSARRGSTRPRRRPRSGHRWSTCRCRRCHRSARVVIVVVCLWGVGLRLVAPLGHSTTTASILFLYRMSGGKKHQQADTASATIGATAVKKAGPPFILCIVHTAVPLLFCGCCRRYQLHTCLHSFVTNNVFFLYT